MKKNEHQLLGKAVMTKEGRRLGRIKDYVIDDTSNKINSIKVKPFHKNEIIKPDNLMNREGYIFPTSHCTSVKGVVILEQDVKLNNKMKK